MSLASLPRLLQRAPQFQTAATYTQTGADFALPAGLNAPLLAALYRERLAQGLTGPLLVIAATSREADAARRALMSLIPEADSCELPAWETLPHERLSPSRETSGKRFKALAKLRRHTGEQPLLMVASVRAVLQGVSSTAATAEPLLLTSGLDVGSLPDFAEELVALGYERVDMVTRRGEFALRGGILDVFSPATASAVRIDFFGDEIESLKEFAVSDQRSAADVAELEIWPARELLITQAVRERAGQLGSEQPQLQEITAKIAQGITAEGMESLIPQLDERQFMLTELLPADSFVAVLSPEKVVSRAVSLAETNAEFFAAAWERAADTPHAATHSGLYTLSAVRQAVPGITWHTLSPFSSADAADVATSVEPAAPADSAVAVADGSADSTADSPAEGSAAAVTNTAQELRLNVPAGQIQQPVGTDSVSHFLALLRERLDAAYTVVLSCAAQGSQDRAAEVLLDADIPAENTLELPQQPQPGVVYVVRGELGTGFELPEARVTVLTEAEFFGRSIGSRPESAGKQARGRSKNVVDPLKLEAGDYVVHETHGIGRFVQLTQKLVSATRRGAGRITREYLVLEYAPSKRGMPADKLFVPTDQLGQLSRYVGGEAPQLSKMGGSDWANAKKKARKAVREIAIELVKLYAARAHAPGFAFSPDTPWQRELEDAFPYVETPDQLAAIADVKRDMERPRPMDRLISGDVGFGKTEIAVRAAFKAVQDNKQVAILVPTTLLVQQHFETFKTRFAGFPVRLRALSRFQSDKEATEVLAGLADGTVDVVIGTHRLLAKGVKYRDLGLLIIDEEQRFGVEHKDALKELKSSVDVLAMSATPIPRTLEMAVTGIREMSQLATAPEDRHPILTFVGQRNPAQTAAAIRREMLREGQVFYVHNRVSSIYRVAKQLAEAVPEARIAVAHGKMNQHELERVVVDFWERKYDVLVCTTIVETGLDIANANTIIIDGAEKYGLSQLHQLRGRVGRSRERAYAYFLYDPDRQLTEHAHERLQTIATHNELGSGMQVALKDLELRGAGNLLGGEQSGHIAGVGFDLYLRMIGEAVSTFKGETVHEARELHLELPATAQIPQSYVESERLRLEAYQKLSAAAHPNAPAEHVDLVLEELSDRYGEPPAEVLELAQLSRLRRIAAQRGVLKIMVSAGRLRIDKLELADSRQMRLQRLYPGASYRAGMIEIPLPPSLSGVAASPLSGLNRGPKAADQATDGDLVGWILRVFAALGDEAKP